VAKTPYIELGVGTVIPILYEDRSVLAIDKPNGWMLAPESWDKTGRNLPRALESSLQARDHWAHSRNLKFIRFLHRLDADTSGVLLLVKSQGAIGPYSRLFESRQMEKTYLAVVEGVPKETEWTCNAKLGPHPDIPGRTRVDEKNGKEATTHFRVLQPGTGTTLVKCRPITGRTHQIRVHLAAAGHPVVDDLLYGSSRGRIKRESPPLALRAIRLAYPDPFDRRKVRIEAPVGDFLRLHGFKDKP